MKREVEQRIETAKAQAVRQRNYRRARDRALARLSKDCDCDNLDQDVLGYTCYKCYEKGK